MILQKNRPTLIDTQRLQIRPIATSDRDAYLEIFGDPDIAVYDDFEAFDEESVDRELARAAGAHARGEPELEYAVVRAEDERLVGVVTTRREGQALYIGYHFNVRYQGVGYATEAVAGVVAHLRDSQRLSIRLKVHPDNARSLRLAAKLGFQLSRGRRSAPDEVELFLPRQAHLPAFP